MKQLDDTITAWTCIYCHQLIRIEDRYIDAIDHMLDFHREELIRERPLLLRDKRDDPRSHS